MRSESFIDYISTRRDFWKLKCVIIIGVSYRSLVKCRKKRITWKKKRLLLIKSPCNQENESHFCDALDRASIVGKTRHFISKAIKKLVILLADRKSAPTGCVRIRKSGRMRRNILCAWTNIWNVGEVVCSFSCLDNSSGIKPLQNIFGLAAND